MRGIECSLYITIHGMEGGSIPLSDMQRQDKKTLQKKPDLLKPLSGHWGSAFEGKSLIVKDNGSLHISEIRLIL
ncbi:hypothetical protein SK128_013873 [Halocaridina rubra]|uniref:Uncharacterized protein n=1 Tax=Halocaridina rubra TaxID=373956 RepID=A0AAN8WC18_HALRR